MKEVQNQEEGGKKVFVNKLKIEKIEDEEIKGGQNKFSYQKLRKGNKLHLNKFHQQTKPNLGKDLRKKNRDLQRLINKGNIEENVKQEKLKELETVQKEISVKQTQFKRKERKEKFLDLKYDKVKKVEMKKVIRKLDQLDKLINETSDQNAIMKLIDHKNEQKDKLNYIKYFPKDRKYLSLFPQNEIQEEMIKKRDEIMAQIKTKEQKKLDFLKQMDLPKPRKQGQQDENQEFSLPKVKYSKLKSKVDDFFMEEEETPKVEKVQRLFINKKGQIQDTKGLN